MSVALLFALRMDTLPMDELSSGICFGAEDDGTMCHICNTGL